MPKYAGVDISRWNTNIDYVALKKAKIEGRTVKFAMLRFSYGKTRDKLFEKHYNGCKAAGIYVGVYHWLKATTVDEAKQEAQWLVDNIGDYKIDYPIALDFEDEELLALGLTKSQYTDIVNAFMDVLKSANYYVVLYTNPNCLENKLSSSVRSQYDLWLAHWTKAPRQYGQKMWQYAALGTESEVNKGHATRVGKVDGANGSIDVNWAFVGYAALIKKLQKNRPVRRYRVTGTKTVDSASLAAAQGQLNALGFSVETEKL